MAARTNNEIFILLSSLKTSISAVIAIIIAFLTPIIPLLLIVGACIALDTIFGVYRSYKLKETITSHKMSRLVSKMVLYQSAVVLFFVIEKYIIGDIALLVTTVPFVVTKLIACTLIFIEGKSINENWKQISGVNIWQELKNMLNRGKELKEDIKDLTK